VSWEGHVHLQTLATSPGAIRHGCQACGTTLSIKYHSQADTLWLAAGALTPAPGADPPVMPLGAGPHFNTYPRP
jgi:hypothetical protein